MADEIKLLQLPVKTAYHVKLNGFTVGQYYADTARLCLTQPDAVSEAQLNLIKQKAEKVRVEEHELPAYDETQVSKTPELPDEVKERLESGNG